jgi:hypothetical protein
VNEDHCLAPTVKTKTRPMTTLADLQMAWEPVLAALIDRRMGASAIVSFAIARRKTPPQIEQADIGQWLKEMPDRKRLPGTI